MRFFTLLAAAAVVCAAALASATPLDDYIAKPDASYTFVDMGVTLNGLDYKAYVYNMTSQTWLSPQDTTRSTWWHYVVIMVPNNVKNYSTGILWITGSDNHMGLPKVTQEDMIVLSMLCVGTGTIGAALFQVPNQPIGFPADPWHDMHRTEDAAIAISWWLFAQQPTKPEWLLYLPMTKAAVRALDTLAAVAPKVLPAGYQPITSFVVAGASKRGWTTWLTGAVDKRVKGMIPIVLDALHVHSFIHREIRYLSALSFALQDYIHANITSFMDTPVFTQLCSIIDPYYYLQRYTMPKLAINAVGDEFQMPDDQRHWAHDAPAPMHLLMVKNAEHAMVTGIFEAVHSAIAFVATIVQPPEMKAKAPTYNWWIENGTGAIHVVASEPMGTVDIAWADSPLDVSTGKRDFRWAALNVSFCPIKVFGGCIRPIIWQTTKQYLTQINSTYWVARMPLPDEGRWRAFIMEIKFANKWSNETYWFTSPTSVIPNTAPFPDCTGLECPTTMV